MKYRLTLIFLFIQAAIFSQIKISGTVVDEQKKSVPFANIVFENSIVGTVSDENGKFYLESDENFSEVEVSFIGYETKNVSIKRRDFNYTCFDNLNEYNIQIIIYYDYFPNSTHYFASEYFKYNNYNVYAYSYIQLEQMVQSILNGFELLTDAEVLELQILINNAPADGKVKHRVMKTLDIIYAETCLWIINIEFKGCPWLNH